MYLCVLHGGLWIWTIVGHINRELPSMDLYIPMFCYTDKFIKSLWKLVTIGISQTKKKIKQSYIRMKQEDGKMRIEKKHVKSITLCRWKSI